MTRAISSDRQNPDILGDHQFCLRGVLSAILLCWLIFLTRFYTVVAAGLAASMQKKPFLLAMSSPGWLLGIVLAVLIGLVLVWYSRRVAGAWVWWLRLSLMLCVCAWHAMPFLAAHGLGLFSAWLILLGQYVFWWAGLLVVSRWLPKQAWVCFFVMVALLIPTTSSLNVLVMHWISANWHFVSLYEFSYLISLVSVGLCVVVIRDGTPYLSDKPGTLLKRPWTLCLQFDWWRWCLVLVAVLWARSALLQYWLNYHAALIALPAQRMMIHKQNLLFMGIILAQVGVSVSIFLAGSHRRSRVVAVGLFAAALFLSAMLFFSGSLSFNALIILSALSLAMMSLGYASMGLMTDRYANDRSWALALFLATTGALGWGGWHLLQSWSVTAAWFGSLSVCLIWAAICMLGAAVLAWIKPTPACYQIISVNWLARIRAFSSGRESLARAFWLLGLYLFIAVWLLTTMLGLAFAPVTSASQVAHHTTVLQQVVVWLMALVSIFWGYCVWRCSRRSSSYVKMAARLFVSLNILLYVLMLWQSFEHLPR